MVKEEEKKEYPVKPEECPHNVLIRTGRSVTTKEEEVLEIILTYYCACCGKQFEFKEKK